MTSNVSPIVQQIQQDFQALLSYVTGPQAHTQTAYTVELTLFRRLLALGAALLRLFFLTRAAARPPAPVSATGMLLTYHDRRAIAYYSFAALRLWTRLQERSLNFTMCVWAFLEGQPLQLPFFAATVTWV